MKASRQLSAFESPTQLIDSSKLDLQIRMVPGRLRSIVCGIGLAVLTLGSSIARGEPILPPTSTVASTVPTRGDLNPYGIAFVPSGVPSSSTLKPGDVLVANFNAASNKQGTGTTIVKLVTDGKPVTFFKGQNLGLTTALAVLKSGFVLVGNLPTTNGTTIPSPGSLLVINPQGRLVSELKDDTLLNGPWDMTVINDHGGPQVTAFVSNVLSGTVARIVINIGDSGATLVKGSSLIIASGYNHRSDPAALVVGPTGLAYDGLNLYVASTADNAVFKVSGAATNTSDGGMGTLVPLDSSHLHGPLALALAPNGDLVTSNGDAVNPSTDPQQASEIVEFTPDGRFIAQMQVDPAAGAAFGLAFGFDSNGQSQFAAVNDATNTATVWTLPSSGN
jgi:hypothetical protein